MSCPNSNPSSTGLVRKYISSQSPATREKLFYFVCIWVRLVLYLSILVYYQEWYIPYIVLVVSTLSAIVLLQQFHNKLPTQWWSKKFQFVITVLLIVVSALIILKKCPYWVSNENCRLLLPILLLISLFGGILQSLTVRFC